MSVWEITNKWMNDVAMLSHPDEIEFDAEKSIGFWKQFEGNGKQLRWSERPKLVVMVEEGRKRPLPRADVSPFTAPGLVFNAKVRSALGDFLSQFGQLLEVDVSGSVEYYFNVTNVLSCLDRERSDVWPTGYVEQPVFDEAALPAEPSVFIDPMVASRIFVNDAAKAVLETAVAEHQLTGMSFKEWRCQKAATGPLR